MAASDSGNKRKSYPTVLLNEPAIAGESKVARLSAPLAVKIKEEPVDFEADRDKRLKREDLFCIRMFNFVESFFIDSTYRKQVIHVLQHTDQSFPSYQKKGKAVDQEAGYLLSSLTNLAISSFEEIGHNFYNAPDQTAFQSAVEHVKKKCTALVECACLDYTPCDAPPFSVVLTQPRPTTTPAAASSFSSSSSSSAPVPEAEMINNDENNSESDTDDDQAPAMRTTRLRAKAAPAPAPESSSPLSDFETEMRRIKASRTRTLPIESLTIEQFEALKHVSFEEAIIFTSSTTRNHLVHVLDRFDLGQHKSKYSADCEQAILQCLVDDAITSFQHMDDEIKYKIMDGPRRRSLILIQAALEQYEKSLAKKHVPQPAPAKKEEKEAEAVPPALPAKLRSLAAPKKELKVQPAVTGFLSDGPRASRLADYWYDSLKAEHEKHHSHEVFMQHAEPLMIDQLRVAKVSDANTADTVFRMIRGRCVADQGPEGQVLTVLENRLVDLGKQCMQHMQQ